MDTLFCTLFTKKQITDMFSIISKTKGEPVIMSDYEADIIMNHDDMTVTLFVKDEKGDIAEWFPFTLDGNKIKLVGDNG